MVTLLSGRHLLFGLLVANLLFSIVGCKQRESPKEAAIVIPLESDVQTLDPAQLSDPVTSRIVWQIYEGLVGLSDDGKAIPLLAESWTHSDDYRIWTFAIRRGVKFHDSDVFESNSKTRTVRAEDVRYSYQRFAKGFGSFVFSGLIEGFDDFVAGRSDRVRGFVAKNDSVFEIRLNRSDPAFLFRITSPYLAIMPKEAVESKDAFGRNIAVGTGPFRLRTRNDSEILLEANPTYWKPASGNLKQVTFRVDKNDQIRITRLEQRVYQLAALPVALQGRFFEDDRLQPKWTAQFSDYRARTFNVHYLGIDNKRLSDIHLRRAIALAVDKDTIVSGLLHGTARVANELVPPGLQGFQLANVSTSDAAAARKELVQSRYKGEPLSLLVSDLPNEEAVAQLLQNQLRNVGIRVQLQKVDMNTFISRLFSKNRPDLFLGFSEWVFSAPELILESYLSTRFPNPNVVGYANPKVDSLLRRVSTLADRAEINKLCQEVSTLAAHDAPLVPLYHLDARFIIDKRYSGFSVNGHQYWNLAAVRFAEK